MPVNPEERQTDRQTEFNCGDKSSIIGFHLIVISINGVLEREKLESLMQS